MGLVIVIHSLNCENELFALNHNLGLNLHRNRIYD